MDMLLPIVPFSKPIRGSLVLPGSKSITNRALILAALSDSVVRLEGALFSEDTHVMVKALQALGFQVQAIPDQQAIIVDGLAGQIPNSDVSLDVGNAGTAARFLTAMLALKGDGHYHITGSAAMKRRPMLGLLEALESHGAITVTYHENYGYFPLSMRTMGLMGGEMQVNASASSQILSALLMVAPLARGRLVLNLLRETVSKPFLSLTQAMMEEFGQVSLLEGAYAYEGDQHYSCPAGVYWVEPDATAASYFGALACVTGSTLTLEGLPGHNMKQGDIAFFDILKFLGLEIVKSPQGWTISADSSSFRESVGLELDFNAISDTFLTLAAMAPLFKGSLTLRGIAHTRHQETDRVAAMASELKRLGQYVEEAEDSLYIEPRPLQSAEIETYEDHRMAMSFAILGCYDLKGDGSPWLSIKNPGCCAKTFPNFFETFEALRHEG